MRTGARGQRIGADRIAKMEILLTQDFSPEQITGGIGDWVLDSSRSSAHCRCIADDVYFADPYCAW
ncbi:hypothetical protein XalbCFBP2523_10430 [Xanthomonas albilineans]|nr:hypothetical protein XalbCFBP2523_10430 [Xanthomonas albilineans]